MPADRRVLREGWEVAASAPDACADPAVAASTLRWSATVVGPGGGLTAASACGEDGRVPSGRDYDTEDWWFRIGVGEPAARAGEELVLGLGGLATLAEVWVDGRRVLESESMYAAHELVLDGGLGELAICCRALAPRLAGRRRPRARWRTRVVAEGNLRFFRTMLLGRAPGFAPGPAVVGPWRPVTLQRRAGVVCETVSLRPGVAGSDGMLAVRGRLRAIGPAALPAAVAVAVGKASTRFEVAPDGTFAGGARVSGARRWWPHTHGEPALHTVRLSADVPDGEATAATARDALLHEARVGFRELRAADDLEADGPALRVNGVDVFCRGAVWTPPSLVDPQADPATLRALLSTAAAAGLNMIRIPGTGCYESAAFHDLCDELGLLVWQDLMFANLDYPEADPDFMAAVEAEVAAELGALAPRPSLAVVCGGSEVAQQVAMMGLDPALASGPLYGGLLPRLVAEAGIDAPYVPSAPWGGPLPFRTGHGVANYFGVGAYLRPLADARAAEVRFASECLAFANVGDGPVPGDGSVLGPAWKAGVPRDVGAGWDFDDVRDHYLRSVFGLDPAPLRYADPERYLALSRQLTGELMAETFGEWRRGGSPCRGGLVLWLKDLLDGAGWGLVDAAGAPKVALAVLARALAPVAVWTTDEGLGGIDVHVANDGGATLPAELRVALYRDGAVRVEDALAPVELAPRSTLTVGVEELLGRFVDVSWAYRFGPPAGDVLAVSLQRSDGTLLSQAFRFPAGRPLERRPASELGLTACLLGVGEDPDRVVVRVGCARIAYGVRIEVPDWVAADDAFCVEPGRPREVALRRRADTGEASETPRGTVSALNCASTVAIGPAASESPG